MNIDETNPFPTDIDKKSIIGLMQYTFHKWYSKLLVRQDHLVLIQILFGKLARIAPIRPQNDSRYQQGGYWSKFGQ